MIDRLETHRTDKMPSGPLGSIGSEEFLQRFLRADDAQTPWVLGFLMAAARERISQLPLPNQFAAWQILDAALPPLDDD